VTYGLSHQLETTIIEAARRLLILMTHLSRATSQPAQVSLLLMGVGEVGSYDLGNSLCIDFHAEFGRMAVVSGTT
jgi:hypothetical protein